MKAPLLDRRPELGTLEASWDRAVTGRPQLAVVWGRRRVGKTFLLSHFVEGKRSVFFGATAQAEHVELARLAEAVGRDLGRRELDLAGGSFTSWEAGLRFLSALARDEPLAVVLDEVPYLARSTPGFASIVQVVWDHIPPRTRLLLVLTGSAVGTIEEMLGSSGALRGRADVSLRLEPVDPLAARLFLPDLSAPALIEAYAACGGYPLHLLAWDQSLSTGANLLQLAMTSGGVLLEDASGMLREELPETGGYRRVLAAIGRGRTRMSEIANEAGQRIEHPIDVLQRARLIRRSLPIGAPRRARPLYEIADFYLAFWFSVLYADHTLVEAGQGDAVLERRQPQWQRHLGWIFEEIARAHAARLVAAGDLPSDLVVGRWWSSTGAPAEVDVLGLRGARTALLGEARWQDAKLGTRDLHELVAKLPRVPDPRDDVAYVLWGRNGIDNGVQSQGVHGFSAEQMLEA